MKQHTYILYHANCLDGMMSAAIAYKYFEEMATLYVDKDNPYRKSYKALADLTGIPTQIEPVNPEQSYLDKVHFIAVSYQEPVPELIPDSTVYILDFSYPREVLLKLMEDHQKVLVLDHHKSAKEQLSGFANAFFNMDESGATMTWKYFYPDQPVPLAVQMIRDRDLWLWEMPNTKPFTEAVYNLEQMDVKQWQVLFNDTYVFDLINKGQAIVKASENQVARQLKSMYWACLPQHCKDVVPFINSSHLISETCQAMYTNYPEAPYVVMWYQVGDTVKVSLRSRKDTGADVSAVAKVYGGGGHLRASGFSIEAEDWFYDSFYGLLPDQETKWNVYQ